MDNTFTFAQLANIFLLMCGGIITVSGACTAVVAIVKKLNAPNALQNGRLDKIEADVENIKKRLNNDDNRLVSIEDGNRVIMSSILSLLKHGIDGNEIDSMRKSQDELTEYLLRR